MVLGSRLLGLGFRESSTNGNRTLGRFIVKLAMAMVIETVVLLSVYSKSNTNGDGNRDTTGL